jgi:hypothetical protein
MLAQQDQKKQRLPSCYRPAPQRSAAREVLKSPHLLDRRRQDHPPPPPPPLPGPPPYPFPHRPPPPFACRHSRTPFHLRLRCVGEQLYGQPEHEATTLGFSWAVHGRSGAGGGESLAFRGPIPTRCPRHRRAAPAGLRIAGTHGEVGAIERGAGEVQLRRDQVRGWEGLRRRARGASWPSPFLACRGRRPELVRGLLTHEDIKCEICFWLTGGRAL